MIDDLLRWRGLLVESYGVDADFGVAVCENANVRARCGFRCMGKMWMLM